MADSDNTLSFPENPHFGSGIYRRRIRLINSRLAEPRSCGATSKVEAELEDTNHAFKCTLFHDQQKITDIQTQSLRIPIDSCPGAAEPIKQLIGLDLDCPQKTIIKTANPKFNCTHLYDLTLLAMSHALRDEHERLYDIDVPDETDNPTTVTVRCNADIVLQWQVRRWQLVKPEEFAGKPLYKGFIQWVSKALSGDQLEAAQLIQKGYFVAQARRYDLEVAAGDPALRDPSMYGVCYSYNSPIVETATRNANTTRDFTDTPELLLKFIQ